MNLAAVLSVGALFTAYWTFSVGQAVRIATRDVSAPRTFNAFSQLFPQRWSFFAPAPEAQFRIVYEFSSSMDETLSPIDVDVSEPILRSRMRLRSVKETLTDSILTNFSMRFLSDVAHINPGLWSHSSERRQEIYREIALQRHGYACLLPLLHYGTRVKGEMHIPDTYDQIRLIIVHCPGTRFEAVTETAGDDRILDISKGSVVYDSFPLPIGSI